MKKHTALDRYVFHQHSTSQRPADKTKGFAVYHCGKACYWNASAAICRSYISKNNLKGAVVGYAK